MQQKTLDAIGRKHTVEEIKEAYALARETGFDNINMDIIAGLPGEDISDMEDTLASDRSDEAGQSDGAFTGNQDERPEWQNERFTPGCEGDT